MAERRPNDHNNIRVQLDVLRDRLAEQRAILDTLVEANAEDGPALQETAQLLADTDVALQEAREEYKRRTQATPASAPATAPDGPPEATQTDRRDRDRDPSRDRSRSRASGPTAPSRLDTSRGAVGAAHLLLAVQPAGRDALRLNPAS